MTGFPLIVLAESVKVSRRTAARLGWVVSAGLGVLLPALLFAQIQLGTVLFGVEAAEYFDATATRPLIWALHARSFFIVRMFLVVLAAQLLATEFQDRTLREALLRPVPRYQVWFGKWLAIVGWDAIALLLTFVIGSVLGVAMFGFGGWWDVVLVAYTLALLTDAALVALSLFVAVATRSVVATVAGVLMALILDMAATFVLFVLSTGGVVRTPWVVQLSEQYPMLLYNALGLWAGGLPGYTFDLRSIGSLGVILAGSLLGGFLVFRRADVP